MGVMQLRTFIAVNFSKQLKEEIRDYINLIKPKVNGHWTNHENMHLTIKFLGEIHQDDVKKIYTVMANSFFDIEPFVLKIGKLGYFPGNKNIRVLWLGLDGELEKLIKLHLRVEENLSSIGFSKENREFKPHITLARDVIADINELPLYSFKNYIFVQEVVLMKSEIISNKRVYTPIFKLQLGERNV